MWKMDPNEFLLSRGGGGACNNGKTGEGFIDRSKVRILLCDNDTKSSKEVFDLLCKCSYQVTRVRSPRQVIDALNAEGPDIDIILSEVDLPMAKGLKLLKYIMRDKELRRIPVIMMSAQDEVSLVVKCLRLGAADYLVKPLRTNELLNLWTHMWRRRRMLGLAEKNIMNCEFDLVLSDPSDANTNSTTLFSDDTDEKSRKSSNPEMSLSIAREDESNAIIAPGPVDTQLVGLSDNLKEQQRGKFVSGPKKSELKIGQSSAFFTYVKSSMFRSSILGGGVSVDETARPGIHNKPNLYGGDAERLTINLTDETTQYVHVEEKVGRWGEHGVSDTGRLDYTQVRENFHGSNSSFDRSSTPSLPAESSQQTNTKTGEFPEGQMQQSGNNYNAYSPYPYYLSGAMNHVMMYQKNMNELHNQYNNIPHFPAHHMPGMAPFPYYPVGLFPPGQTPSAMHHPWPPYGGSSSDQVKVHKLDRREAALMKFRQKRKERCFDKKIRYVNRKKLAERRPRVRGQFVRKINGINVDLNGQPTSNDFDDEEDDDEEEEDDDDEQAGRGFSPENVYAGFHG